jgi:ELWxxDGT repeat protein
MQTIRHSFIALITLFSVIANAQTTMLNNNKSLEFLGLLNNKVVLTSLIDKSIWVSDGTPAGTVQITNTVTYEDGGSNVLNNILYFSGKSTATGTELWRTDGTAGGTYMVKDINPGPESSFPTDRFIIQNNEIYFSAYTTTHGREIWKTNGSTNGTVMVKDITVGTGSSNNSAFYKLTHTSNYTYFITNSAGTAGQFWRTDGTNAGTIMLSDFTPNGNFAVPIIIGTMNNKIFFSTVTAATGRELWVSDGTVAGTTLVQDINFGLNGSFPDNAFEFNGKLYFSAESATEGKELWVTDGTTAGTKLVKDIEPGDGWSDPILFNAIKTNNKFYFTTFTTANGYEIWESDGTANGTKLFVDIEPGAGDAFPFLLSPFINGNGGLGGPLFQGNKFFFTAFTVTTGLELYVSDGTSQGTKLVKDISAGIGDGITQQAWFYTNNYLYFSGTDNVFATELWRTDGTANNTLMVNDLNPFAASSDPSPMVIVNNKLLFVANNGDAAASDLFVVNTSEQVLPVNLISFNGKQETDNHILTWKTANETNVAQYIVERSTNGRQFSAIGNIAAAGLAQYQFVDRNVANTNTTYYYRLQIKDADGSIKYSSIIKLQQLGQSAFVKVYQTANAALAIQYQLPEQKSSFSIIDATGKLIQTGTLAGNNGTTQIKLPETSRGMFVLKIQSGNYSAAQQIILH